MIDQFAFVAEIDEMVVSEEAAVSDKEPSSLIINKLGKFMRGHIVDHNVRVSGGKLRGRIVFLMEGQKKEVDANDIQSLEKLSKN